MSDTLTNELLTHTTENKPRITTQFYFDSAQHALIGPDDSIVYLRPQSLEVMLLLLRNANEVVTKQVILDTVWKNINVTDDSVTQCIADIRDCISD